MHRITAIAATALAAAATIGATATPAHAASSSSRLKKLEKQMKTVLHTNAVQANQIGALRTRATLDERTIASQRTQLDTTTSLLVNCFQSTSMDLGLAPDWLSVFDGTSFLGYQGALIVPSLHSGDAGPFYMATIRASCVGAVTPVPSAGLSRSSLQKPPTMFPNSELPFRSLPSK